MVCQRVLTSVASNFCCDETERRKLYTPLADPWVGKIPWKKEKLPTLVFWPGGFHGLYSPWDRKESDRTG